VPAESPLMFLDLDRSSPIATDLMPDVYGI
jgi:hypothetical protein